MAQLAVEGINVILRIKKAGSYEPYACAISVTYTREREAIETSTVDSAGESEFEYGMGSWGATLNGVTHIVPTAGSGITAFDILDMMNSKMVAEIELAFEDEEGNIKTITGRALIVHLGLDAGSEGFSEDDIELKGTGVPTINTALIDPSIIDTEVFKLEYTAAGDEETLHFDELVGKNKTQILHVHRDISNLEVIDVGTPTDKQIKFISATGNLSLPYPAGAGEYFLILYK